MKKVRFDHLKSEVFKMQGDTLLFGFCEICVSKSLMYLIFRKSVFNIKVFIPPSDLSSLCDFYSRMA